MKNQRKHTDANRLNAIKMRSAFFGVGGLTLALMLGFSCASPKAQSTAIGISNTLRMTSRNIYLSTTNELYFSVEKGRLPCELLLDCRMLSTGFVTVMCENGWVTFLPSNCVEVSSSNGISRFCSDNHVASVVFNVGKEDGVLVIDKEGLRRQLPFKEERSILRCMFSEKDKYFLIKFPIRLSNETDPTEIQFKVLSNWYEFRT